MVIILLSFGIRVAFDVSFRWGVWLFGARRWNATNEATELVHSDVRRWNNPMKRSYRTWTYWLDGVSSAVDSGFRKVRVCTVYLRIDSTTGYSSKRGDWERGGRRNAMHRQVVRCEWQAVECGPGLRRWSRLSKAAHGPPRSPPAAITPPHPTAGAPQHIPIKYRSCLAVGISLPYLKRHLRSLF